MEQRRRYKTEFDNDFAEYRQLFSVIDRVKQRFAQLEEELRNVRDNQQYKIRVSLTSLRNVRNVINYCLIV